MIADHLDNTAHYHLGARWQQAFDFLRTLTADTPVGEYPLDGENLFAKVLTYDTRSPEEGKIESHRHYADIQICLVGAEGIDLFDSNQLDISQPYDPNTDLTFYQPDTARQIGCIDLHPGQFTILWPRDAHRPQMIVGPEAQSIKKAVVKVAL